MINEQYETRSFLYIEISAVNNDNAPVSIAIFFCKYHRCICYAVSLVSCLWRFWYVRSKLNRFLLVLLTSHHQSVVLLIFKSGYQEHYRCQELDLWTGIFPKGELGLVHTKDTDLLITVLANVLTMLFHQQTQHKLLKWIANILMLLLLLTVSFTLMEYNAVTLLIFFSHFLHLIQAVWVLCVTTGILLQNVVLSDKLCFHLYWICNFDDAILLTWGKFSTGVWHKTHS